MTPRIVYMFKGHLSRDSRCGLDVIPLSVGRTAVICTELMDNPGTCVTAFAAELATAVCRHCALNPLGLVWIEHREHDGSYHLVTFKLAPDPDARGYRITSPSWRPMTPDDWHELGLAVPGAGAASRRWGEP